MKTKIVAIGNSQGVRIPKALLEQTGLKGEVVIEVEGDTLVIRSTRKTRQGWREDAKRMAENGDDGLLWPDNVALSSFDHEEWEWPGLDSTSTSPTSTPPSEAKSKRRGRASSLRRTK
jgi:antitoxin MazE